MATTEVGAVGGRPVLHFHGAASSADDGPSAELCEQLGVRLLRHRRPGYNSAENRPNASLVEVASAVLSETKALGIASIPVLGWSGGGPYALAAAVSDPSTVTRVALIASWAPMRPPHPDLPAGVKFFMKLSRHVPRRVFALAFAATGRTTPGHVDDVRRVAAEWGFTPAAVAPRTPVSVWHSNSDNRVPIGPWRNTPGVDAYFVDGNWHDPPEHIWHDALVRLVAS